MVIIRLSRGGSKKTPFYHFDVKDSRRSRDGRRIERLGFYNPGARGGEERLKIDLARVASGENELTASGQGHALVGDRSRSAKFFGPQVLPRGVVARHKITSSPWSAQEVLSAHVDLVHEEPSNSDTAATIHFHAYALVRPRTTEAPGPQVLARRVVFGDKEVPVAHR